MKRIKQITPDDLTEPYDWGQVQRMIDSWHSTPRANWPASVRLCDELLRGCTGLADIAEACASEAARLETRVEARDKMAWQALCRSRRRSHLSSDKD